MPYNLYIVFIRILKFIPISVSKRTFVERFYRQNLSRPLILGKLVFLYKLGDCPISYQ